MLVKIENSKSVGYKHFNSSFNSYFVYNSPFMPQRVEISKVIIIEDRTINPVNSFCALRNTLLGAIVSGFVGALFMSSNSKVKWDVELDVYLTNGMRLEITATDEETVRRLYPYMVRTTRRKRNGK